MKNEAMGVFERVEKKYLLRPEQYKDLQPVLKKHMEVDEFGLDTIDTIYFDTARYDMIRRSLDKPVYKEKLRLRGYGRVTGDSPVYAEIKKKYKGVVYKRRLAISPRQAYDWWYRGRQRPVDTQIAREIDYMLDFYRPQPMVYIGYERVAMYGKENPDLRITFDSNLRFRRDHLQLTQGSYGQMLLDEPMYLMEVKIPGALPLWLAKAMSLLEIRSTTFSKYGLCYTKFLSQPIDIIKKEAVVC